MSERIDIDALHDIIQKHLVSGGGHELDSLHAELKRMYAREDELLDALRIIRDDLDEAISAILSPWERQRRVASIAVTKVRNFANDASQ